VALDLNKSPPHDEELLPDLKPVDDELLPDLNEPVAKELVQQDHNLDAAEVAGGQQQLISPGN
jgi:hypothetical protein